MTSIDAKTTIEECKQIITIAEKKGVVLRAIGAVAFRLHCPDSRDLLEQMNRELTDIDFVTLHESNDKLDDLLGEFGWKIGNWVWNKKQFALMYNRRAFERNGIKMDVFFDDLSMCHKIHLRERLKIDDFTIPLADLLLEKMQIVKINEKDVKDVIILLKEHVVGMNENKETIDAEFIADLLSKDWGFYYTVTENLKKIRDHFLDNYQIFALKERTEVKQKIDKLLETIEKKPKTLSWKMRARVGTRKQWYMDVEETFR